MQRKHHQYHEFHKTLQQQSSLEETLVDVSNTLKKMLTVQRASVLLYDNKAKQFWTKIANHDEKIVVPYDQGIVGESYRTGKVQLENEPYDNPNFFAEIDMQLGFYTQNILAAPLFNTKEEIIGVLELINKPDGFTKEDRELISYFTDTISSVVAKHLSE